MTPQLARFALCAFAFLAGAVAVNAFYLQGRTVAPPQATAADRTAPAAVRTQVRDDRRLQPMQANAAKLENPPEPGAVDGRPDTIKAIQRELTTRGYGPITVDGVAGLSTRAAIMAFEANEGLPLTAIANEQMLKSILLGAQSSAARKAAEPSARAQEVIRAVQNWLLSLGYAAGPANGLMSPETEKAIRAFEANAGLAAKGRITADLVKRLADAAPLKAAAR
jgi:peptidoglycan hydrolase-like protein with peptidoglycan-binding domain